MSAQDLYVYAGKFNSYITKLARIYVEKKKGTFDEDKAYRTKQRLAVLVSADPIYLIENSGPFFLKYAKLIQAGRWDEFMKMDFTTEKKMYGSSKDGQNHNNKSMDGKIKFIKKIWGTSNEKEKELLAEYLTSMLSSYCEFAIAVKSGATK